MPTLTRKDIERYSATRMTDVILGYETSQEPAMGPLVADEMEGWISDGLRNGYILDVTPRKPLRLPELPFEVKGTVKKS